MRQNSLGQYAQCIFTPLHNNAPGTLGRYTKLPDIVIRVRSKRCWRALPHKTHDAVAKSLRHNTGAL